MRKLTVACFSPSGGTRRAAQLLAERLGESYAWLDLVEGAQRTAALGKDDLLLLALPVYAGQIPAVEGLLDGLSGQNTACVLLATYGNRHYDDALAQLQKNMAQRGFRCVGAAAVITPHIFAPTLGAGRPDGEDMALLTAFAEQVRKKLKQKDLAAPELPGNPQPEPKKAVLVPKSRDMERCVRCGLCAKRCPAGAMDKETLVWDEERCISCMACVSICPKGALSFDAAPLHERLTTNFSQPRPVEIFI